MEKNSFWKRLSTNKVYSVLFIGAVCLVMIVIAAMVIKSILSPAKPDGSVPASESTSAAVTAAAVSSAAEETTSASESEKPEEKSDKLPSEDLSPLAEKLKEKTSKYDGDWSIYVCHLGTGETLVQGSKPMYAASLIKLFCFGAIEDAVSEGKLKESEVRDLEKRMITQSDNFAFDALVEMLPDDYITEWCEKHGYTDTEQNHCIGSEWAYQVERTAEQDNATSVQDVGDLLVAAYKGEFVSEDISKKLVDLMLKQEVRTKIPASLPKNVKCANKTGETDDVCHDSAIVWSDGGDYVVVIMSEIIGTGWTGDPYVRELSKIVYNYFNPKK